MKKKLLYLIMGGMLASLSSYSQTPAIEVKNGCLYLYAQDGATNENSYDVRFGNNGDWGIERYGKGLNFYNSAGDYRLYLNDNGNVGIGAGANPASKLHVMGDVYIPYGSSYWIGSNSDQNARLRLHNNSYSSYIDYSPSLKIRSGNGTPVMEFNEGSVNVNALLSVQGYLVSCGSRILSDKRLKTNIEQLDDDNKLLSINAFSYDMVKPAEIQKLMRSRTASDTSSIKEVKIPEYYNRKHVGFIAQELKKTYPDMVFEDENGIMSVDYVSFIPIIVETIKKQHNDNTELRTTLAKTTDELTSIRKEFASIRASVEKCCPTGGNKLISAIDDKSGTETTTVVENDGNGTSSDAKLYQNVPNPFSENTLVRVDIPTGITKARICIYNLTGTQLKEFTVEGRGQASVTIASGELLPGMYLYALLANEQLVDTKTMVVTK